ncbi:heme peroxidase [Chytriomyces sp. MP71]|nr:heme peroxidase [Chytriomyces sp. MP71]
MKVLAIAPYLVLAGVVHASPCPFAHSNTFSYRDAPPRSSRTKTPTQGATSPNADFDAIKVDIVALLRSTNPSWPADNGNYGGLMIRLAWHCNGSHRNSDGRGGCDGARIRFNPEHSWPDNTNLDKALDLLRPIHEKWGSDISWGDLIVLTGNTAVEFVQSMGGPKLGFCAGRVDDVDGKASLILGPTGEQQTEDACAVQGNCTIPFGSTTVGLIYVNPEGPMGVPDPVATVATIRDTFQRMGFGDEETVALIGGGHAFGKMHGACPTGAGPSPLENPSTPWPGTCGMGSLKGKGPNTFTSGFEGAWTVTPTAWSNDYFSNLLNFDWVSFRGPGNHTQWKPSNDNAPNIRMLTVDVALLHDPDYKRYVQKFSSNLTYLESVFAPAWYQLMTADMGPRSRCINADAPPAQPWQWPLPAPPAKPPSLAAVQSQVIALIQSSTTDAAAQFVHLAYQCASTYRATDYRGGCNGARIRLSPEREYSSNAGLQDTLALLAPVKEAFGPNLTWADLIVVAAQVALNTGNEGLRLGVRTGRSDALEGSNVFEKYELAPRTYYTTPEFEVMDGQVIMGLTEHEVVALAGRPRSETLQAIGWNGCPQNVLSSCYFKTLLSETWTLSKASNGTYRNADGSKFMLGTDLALLNVAKYRKIVQEFAASETSLFTHFKAAWSYLINADLYGTSHQFA